MRTKNGIQYTTTVDTGKGFLGVYLQSNDIFIANATVSVVSNKEVPSILTQISVLPEVRGNGLGTVLLNTVLKETDKRGLDMMCEVDITSGINYELVMHMLTKAKFKEVVYYGLPCMFRKARKPRTGTPSGKKKTAKK